VSVHDASLFLFLTSLSSALARLFNIQHHAERLRLDDSPLQHMQRVFQGVEGMNEAELRRQLGEYRPPFRVFGFRNATLLELVFVRVLGSSPIVW